ncbi:chemotaxis protein CheB [soil metagenome]
MLKPKNGKKQATPKDIVVDRVPKKGTDKPTAENHFPIVAIGASSGGLEAVTELLKYLPADTGMAFIFIQHLSPDYKSVLALLMSKSTNMKVQEIDDMELMKPNNVYVIPNDKGIEVTNGHIELTPRNKSTSKLTIDTLFTSLAETHKEGAIGIVLSGNLSDGTLGLKAIKEEGGITFAQNNTARYAGMPESAIAEGVADFILSPREIAEELGRLSKHTSKGKKILKPGHEDNIEDDNPELKQMLLLLHQSTGVDFTGYRMNTIKRRILRRMLLFKIATLPQYLKHLKSDRKEVELLYNDLLINVTDFFRDPDAFQYIKTYVLGKLVKQKAPTEKFRLWVTACSTGQEAFSIAIMLIELMGDKFPEKQVQIFASDLSQHAIKKARKGEFTKHEVRGVSPKRLEQFFTEKDNTYRITKQVRDLCSFAPHNILADPPFSRMDFISCCNMLIYFDSEVQKKVLTTFQYALNDGGYLMLGKSETAGNSPSFSTVSKKYKIYARKEGNRSMPALNPRVPQPKKNSKELVRKDNLLIKATINDIIFNRYVPAYVVINHSLDIQQFKGPTSNYLEHATGKATLNIMKMAKPEIAFELRDAINKAIARKKEVHKAGIEMNDENLPHLIALDVIPLNNEEEPLLLVVFTQQVELAEQTSQSGKPLSAKKMNSLRKIKNELLVIRAELVSVSEEKEKSYRILQAANEEISASNEEFQSMNEELDTSREEIESANEELITTNLELQARNDQLAEAYNFSEAIVATLHDPMLILDKHMVIKSCNKSFCKTFKVEQEDTEGKLLYELGNHQWDIPGLRKLLQSVTATKDVFYDYEMTHTFPEIGKKTMLVNVRRIIQKAKHDQLVLLAFTDITDISHKRKAEKQELENIISERTKELERSLNTLADKNVSLEKMNKELETFTFISSHDLQEPLRKIQNFTLCMLNEEKQNLTTGGKDYLNRMQESVKRMQRLIDDLLTYSKVKNPELRFEKVEYTLVVKQLMEDFAEPIQEKKVTIATSGLSEFNVIPFQFRQLLHNLISNSLKFADSKRKIRISIKCSVFRAKKLTGKGLKPGIDYTHMTFTDNGIGFDNKYKDRIFQVFQRLHSYEEYKGTGIGLAICKRIVENHHGIITTTSTLGKGAQFDIYLPVLV